MSRIRALASLVAKELRVLSWGITIGLPLCLLQGMTFLMWSAVGFVADMAVWTLVLALAGTALEHRYRVEALLASLPVRRGTLVAFRYLWCALAVALMLGLSAAEARLGLALGIRAPSLAPLGAARSILFMAATSLPLLVFLPFCFRWGPGAGAIRFSVAAAGAAVLGGAAALIARSAGAKAGLAAWLSQLPARLVAAIGAAPAMLLAALLLLALGLASARLSASLYARRDL